MKRVKKRHARQRKPAARSSKRLPALESSDRFEERDRLVGELELQLTRLKWKEQEILRAQQSTENVANYYADLFNMAPVGYLILHVSGNILEINQAGLNILGQKSQEIKGKPFSVFLEEDQVAKFLEHLRRARIARKPVVTELALGASVNAFAIVELVSRPATGRDGNTVVRTVMLDITERKRAEQAWLENERNYRNILNSIEGIVWEGTEGPGEFTFVSQQAKQILGYPADRWLNEPGFWEARLHPDDRNRVLNVRMQAVAERRPYLVEFRMFDSSRRIVWLRDSAHVMRDGRGRIRLQGVMVNITELKEAEEALREETRMLETVNRIGTLLTGQLDFTKLVAAITDAGKQVTGAKYGAFFYKRSESVDEAMALYVTPGATREIFEQLPLPRHRPGTPPMEVERDAVRIHDLLEGKQLHAAPKGKHSPPLDAMRSYLAIPVVSQNNEVLGGLLFGHPMPGIFTERAQHLLAGIASEAAIALDNARLYRAVMKSESHFRKLADAMPQIVWTARANGQVDYFNNRWYEYTGLPAGSLGEHGWMAVLHPEDCERCLEGWKKSIAGGRQFEAECRLQERRTGRYRWHLVRVVPNLDDQDCVLSWFGTCTDIDDQKRVEGEIRELNSALEKRVAERTAQLQASNQELEAFSYSVSHDLRAPLRSIDAFSQLVREDYQDKLDSQGKEYLGIVGNASRQMGQLIDDLLHLSRVTRTEMRRGPVDLSALAEMIVTNLRQLEPARQVEMTIEPNLQAQGDVQLLRVVLENLLNNAWKFTSRKPGARIEMGAEGQNGERVFFVRDNGAGFDMSYSNKLFTAFQRLHSTSEFPGHGIGLATVQRIIHRHGGRIWADAAVDKGATFYFTLPE
ncbi:MAG TPA: PAS domain S-box protein [Verrucomicrobiae bacterium]|nr:PAS domain S-box protein [Verrucomicrobiae bacterium]